MVGRRKVIFTDASKSGWGALCDGHPAFCTWTSTESELHNNHLELLVVC